VLDPGSNRTRLASRIGACALEIWRRSRATQDFEAALALVARLNRPLLTAQIRLELARAWKTTDVGGALAAFGWERLPGYIALDTVTLEEIDGQTRSTSVSVFQSVADRDGMVQSGMEEGVREGMDRMDGTSQPAR
jgi:hypothetical protein